MDTGHGFVWPEGMPACGLCHADANDRIHVTPARRTWAAMHRDDGPRTSHTYVLPSGRGVTDVLCLACSRTLNDPRHPAGMPSGALHVGTPVRAVEERQAAFVAQLGNKIVLAGRATTGADYLPERMLASVRNRSGAHMWVTGRYVEADSPNRNAAYWSTEDLQFGQPSVSSGPINWLHQERHIIGSIADSELVQVDREAAGEGVGNHIVALGAVWPWVYPAEAKIIASASESQSLWFSMECVSRTVACLEDGCGNDMAYADYMLKKDTRCEHMKDGRPRRFVDPIFEGAGIIVPPVRPGWSNADARVLMPEAAKLVERQAAAFTGCSDEEAESVAAQLLAAAEAA